MKKITRSFISFALLSVLLFSSCVVSINSQEKYASGEINEESIEALNQTDSLVYSLDNYNIVRHNFDTSTNDYLYFTNSAATMRGSSIGEDEFFSEGYFPENLTTTSSRTIIGTDDRERVSDTTVAPYSAVCRIVCIFEDIRYNPTNEIVPIYTYGTGFLTGYNQIMSAGHLFYGDITVDNCDDGIFNPRFPDRIIVQPGAYLDDLGNLIKPFGEYEVKSCYIQKTYYNTIDINYDWGIGILYDDDIWKETGCFGMYSNTSDNTVLSYDINVPGYPADKYGDMYTAEGKIIDVNRYRIYHNADAIDCNSGSPLYFVEDGYCFVEGLHTTSEGTRNGATRLTMFIFDLSISLSHRDYPCEILDAYYIGDSYNKYNCVLNIVYTPPENKQLLLSKDGVVFDKVITGNQQEFYSSTTSSKKVDFDYKYYKTFDPDTGLYSGVKILHNYTDYGLSTEYKIVSRNDNGDIISTSYDQADNLWQHGGNKGKTIKGTIVFNNQARNLEVKIPLLGYKTSSEITIDGVTFQLRAGPKKVSIKASQTLTCSQNVFFAFAVE